MGASLVDLPNIQLFIVIDTFVHLIWFVSFRCAPIHNFGDFGWFVDARLLHHFFDQIVDFVGGCMSAEITIMTLIIES